MPCHTLLQVSVGGRNHPYIHAQIVVAADALHLALLQKAQNLALQRQRHVADFVQKQRSAMRGLNAPDARLQRAGKCALGVAEQLGFQQRVGNGRAVDHHQRLVAPRTDQVQFLGHQVFARAAFAQHQHRGVARSHHARQRVGPHHLLRVADHAA